MAECENVCLNLLKKMVDSDCDYMTGKSSRVNKSRK